MQEQYRQEAEQWERGGQEQGGKPPWWIKAALVFALLFLLPLGVKKAGEFRAAPAVEARVECREPKALELLTRPDGGRYFAPARFTIRRLPQELEVRSVLGASDYTLIVDGQRKTGIVAPGRPDTYIVEKRAGELVVTRLTPGGDKPPALGGN